MENLRVNMMYYLLHFIIQEELYCFPVTYLFHSQLHLMHHHSPFSHHIFVSVRYTNHFHIQTRCLYRSLRETQRERQIKCLTHSKIQLQYSITTLCFKKKKNSQFLPQFISSVLSPQSSIPSHFQNIGLHRPFLQLIKLA